MPYLFDQLRSEATALIAATGLVPASAITLAEPKANVPADLAFPVFASAKAAGTNPNEFAKRLAESVTLSDDSLFGKVEAMGGFVNLSVRPEKIAPLVIAEVSERGDAYGEDKTVGAGEKTVVEFSSPNIARKMHVGHLRSTVIGHAIYKIFKALGYDVIGDNHLGDWGTQFGTLLAALDLWKREPWNESDPVQSLVYIYGQFNNASRLEEMLTEQGEPEDKDKSPEANAWRASNSLIRSLKEDTVGPLSDLGRSWFHKLENGDEWSRATWKKLIDITMAEFDRTYKRFDVEFDTQHGESYYEPMLTDVINEALAKGVAKIEDGGPVVVDFEDTLPSCLLRKTDGATLYQTRDAATILYRWREYHPARNIYVVGAEQKLHFQQVFEIVRRMGYTEIADRSIHIPFGAVTDINGEKFGMRKGNAVFLNEVLDEAIERAAVKVREQIEIGKSEATEAEIPGIAEIVGIGAIIYSDLFQGPERNIRFDWDKMIAWEGNTATYIQYTYTRCKSILRKAGDITATANTSILVAPEEQAVLKQLARMPHAVREAGDKYLPAIVAEWTYNLAREFARFYDKCPVLTAETEELKTARLALVSAVAQGLKNGLSLLGIKAPERM